LLTVVCQLTIIECLRASARFSRDGLVVISNPVSFTRSVDHALLRK